MKFKPIELMSAIIYYGDSTHRGFRFRFEENNTIIFCQSKYLTWHQFCTRQFICTAIDMEIPSRQSSTTRFYNRVYKLGIR